MHVTEAESEPMIDNGIQNYDLSLEALYSGLRMSLTSAYNEHEFFLQINQSEYRKEHRPGKLKERWLYGKI